MAKFEIEFDVICEKCGEALTITINQDRFGNQVIVEPCDACMAEQYNEGLSDGEK